MPLNISKLPIQETLHGVTVRDPYRWLEDRSLPETEEWIREQQRQCETYFEACPDLDTLERRVRDYLNVEVVDQPARVEDRYFYRKRRRSEEQGSLYVRRFGTEIERLLVDPSKLGASTSVGIHSIAEDGKLLAVEVRRGGEDRKEIRVLDVEGRLLLPDRIPLGYARGFTFVNENTGYLYAQETLNSSNEHSIRLHNIGEQARDEVLFRVPRCAGSRLILMANTDLLGAFWIRHSGSGRIADFWVAARTSPRDWSKVFASRQIPYSPLFCQNRIFAFAETASRRQRVVEVTFEGEELRVVVPETESRIRECAVIKDRLYLSRWVQGASKIDVWDIAGQENIPIDLPEDGTVRMLPCFTQTADGFFYSRESFDSPPAIYEYDSRNGTSRLWYQQGPLHRGRSFKVRKEVFPSKDGVLVPVTLVTHKEEINSCPSPVIMTSYGGFGVVMSPQFSVLVAIMMELGAILAVPHIRGGGEFGKAWHDAGRARNRQVCFDDFIAAAEWLCNQGISSPRQLATFGGSNSGLLVAAAMTQRPDLFAAVLCIAPLLDMIRYESFDQATKWRDEYGTVGDPEEFRALYAYSPYHHVAEDINYPPTLFVTGDKDDRCNPAHVRKMAAVLQERNSQKSPVIVDYSEARGHAPALPLSVRVSALARRIAFLCRELAISLPKGDLDVAPRS